MNKDNCEKTPFRYKYLKYYIFFNSNPIVLSGSVSGFRTTEDFIEGTVCLAKSYLLSAVFLFM